MDAAAAKSLQSCPTLCDPMDGSPPGSSVRGIFQAGVLEWVAIAFSTVDMSLSKLREIVKETGKPGVLQFVGLQRVRYDLVTQHQQQLTFAQRKERTETVFRMFLV